MRIFVAVATLGRPDIVRRTVRHLERQTRRPDGVLLSVVRPEDAGGVASTRFDIAIETGAKGLCRQRNTALAALAGQADIVLFLDDDFVVADDYLAVLERFFAARLDLVGATGRVIADGIGGAGIAFDEAVALIAADVPERDLAIHATHSLYGCNMAVRMAAVADMRFDEALPLYGWLEDIDFTYRLGRRGRMLRIGAARGVHMGVKGGRTSGRKLGYSQIANPVHLLRKHSAPPDLAWRMMRNNLAANIARSLRPEPHIDRLGRLRGNMQALGDLLRGRLDPRRILELD